MKIDDFKTPGLDCTFLFVNDGSQDNTLEIIKKTQRDDIYYLNLEKNFGKGEAIRQGVLFAKSLPIYEEISWVGYWDADLATPLSELTYFLKYANDLAGKRIEAIWGSRISKLGSTIERTPIRHYLGRLFATITGLILKINCYDSQCGAKIFRKEITDMAFSRRFISCWIFDVEILLRLEDYNILECPLRFWRDVPGSKVKIFSVGFRTLIEISKIRKIYRAKAK